MQQTENYKLNLIETTDPFSPVPLNENAQTLESVLAAKTDLTDTAALEQRVVALEGHHAVAGIYIGNGKAGGDTQLIQLGFTPMVVVLGGRNNLYMLDRRGLLPAGSTSNGILEGGFQVGVSTNLSYNADGIVYPYLAIG